MVGRKLGKRLGGAPRGKKKTGEDPGGEEAKTLQRHHTRGKALGIQQQSDCSIKGGENHEKRF